ncbi:BLUF domain-containing protein [Thalassolituus hydrocarboniclasticus]|uniref:BLUF domain-containing protein n=1 Tax=Thalassolituus hydrocarboniclasticus TaxID=2742796 RepID=A0ABY6A6V5_9GAMM|nr:BLUF domain-containing protein [Thalassolituus hydrocarboniclasticus]UXD86731.1 BLUF domain-containing protein [Thalassolituus hydrocarboniclasticus]
MNLVRLIYASRKTEFWNDLELGRLLENAQRYNKAHHITGILYFNRKYFLQCIEGQREIVSSLYNEIVQDRRHCDVQILAFDEIDERDMEHWHMSYLPDSQITQSMVLKYTNSTDFDPFSMTARGALSFMRNACHLLRASQQSA